MEDITLRPATIEDADFLLAWRNDTDTRNASHVTAVVPMEDHIGWLTKTISNPSRRLLVAEEIGRPVGTVRADLVDGIYELSWTVAPAARGRGVAKRMVSMLAKQISEPIRCEIKPGNAASIRVAEYAGMEYDRETDGVLHFTRTAE